VKNTLNVDYELERILEEGNFEGLSCANRSIFFLFIAKCHVIAKDVEYDVGDTI
jgi:uncharacterized protein with ATP-grasp and redox domains